MNKKFAKVLAVCCVGFLALQHAALFPQTIAEAVYSPEIAYLTDDDPEKFKYMNPTEENRLSGATADTTVQDPTEPDSTDEETTEDSTEETTEDTTEPTTDDSEAIIHNSRFDTDYTLYHGIDVSKYQYTVDWEAVAEDNIDYAIVRLGFRGYGAAGNMAMDPMYETNMEGALNAGLDVGVYFFTQALNEEEAIEEANYVLENLNGYPLTMPIYIDIEYVEGAVGRMDSAGLTNEERTAICDAFCATIEAAGYRAGVYANKNWLTTMLDDEYLASKYEIWLAHYTTETPYEGEYVAWQYTSTGTVEGVTGNVDRDVYYSRDLAYAESSVILKEMTPYAPEFVGGGNILYTSSNPEVAIVAKNGVIVPVSRGTTTITASSDNGSVAFLEVTVDPRVMLDNSSIYFEKINDSCQLNILHANSDVVWSTTDPSVAIVDQTGLVQIVGYGTAMIIATDMEGYSAICNVTLPKALIQTGDCNIDGVINSADAAEVLIYASMMGAGATTPLDETMIAVYDVTGDEIINSLDAADILIYCAAAGAGGSSE